MNKGFSIKIPYGLCAGLILATSFSADAQTPFKEPTFSAMARSQAPRPRLVVVLSIDQFRGDYLERYGDLLLPAVDKDGNIGGFRYLMEQGAFFVDARHGHYPLFTGPGHAALLTGAYPSKHGIVSNEWWNRAGDSTLYCVADSTVTPVGAASASKVGPMGPRNLRVSTVGDELKLATAGNAKVVGIAFKDRAAILMAGHAADVVLWLDNSPDGQGHWISSTAYAKKGHLPGWVNNSSGLLQQPKLPDWEYPALLDTAIRARTFVSAAEKPNGEGPAKLGTTYAPNSPHKVTSVEAFTFTPAASKFLLDTAQAAVTGEGLGSDPVPDLLALSLSSFDYAGHAYGPYSAEMLDHVVKMDSALADFLRFLDKDAKIEGGLSSVVFSISADHGVAPAPEDAVAFGLPGGRVDESKIRSAVEDALRIRFGDMPCGWIDGKGKGFMLSEGWIYLNEDAVRFALSSSKAGSRAEIERAVVEALRTTLVPGIYRAFAADDLLNGVDGSDMARRVSRGVYPTVSGDIVVIQEPMFQFGEVSAKYVTSHGTPYIYDAHVPLLLLGPGIEPGVYTEPVEIVDLAPTLAALLGIESPSGADGHLLRAALK